MSSCKHAWVMVDVQGKPLACTVVCEFCHAIVGARVFERAGRLVVELGVRSYGHGGLGIEDMRALHAWLVSFVGMKPAASSPAVVPARAQRRRRRAPARAA